MQGLACGCRAYLLVDGLLSVDACLRHNAIKLTPCVERFLGRGEQLVDGGEKVGTHDIVLGRDDVQCAMLLIDRFEDSCGQALALKY